MLGHLKPTTNILCADENQSYRKYYCSISSVLRKSGSLAHSKCINNELTLLLLAYDNYIDGADDSTRCPGKAYTLKKQIAQHPAISKAGEFSLLLGWLKILDVSNDNPGASIKIIKRLFRKIASFLIEHSVEGIQEIFEDYKPDIENNEPEFEELHHHTG